MERLICENEPEASAIPRRMANELDEILRDVIDGPRAEPQAPQDSTTH